MTTNASAVEFMLRNEFQRGGLDVFHSAFAICPHLDSANINLPDTANYASGWYSLATSRPWPYQLTGNSGVLMNGKNHDHRRAPLAARRSKSVALSDPRYPCNEVTA